MLTSVMGVAALMLAMSGTDSRKVIVELKHATGAQVLLDKGFVGQPMFAPQDPVAAKLAGLDRFLVFSASSETELSQVHQLGQQSEVLSAVQDGLVHACERLPNDEDFGRQYSLRNTGQVVGGVPGTIGADINAPAAWEISTGAPSVAIAILDTGVSGTHPDLSGKIILGRNFVGADETAWEDDNGHGTHSAGIAAARSDDEVGVAGVCWECSIVVGRVLDEQGIGTWSGVAAAIVWAADQDLVRVISLNFGGTATDPATFAAVNYATARGKLMVAAAGNTFGGEVLFPARFENCIAVSATDHFDRLADFSARGSAIDLAAPGAEVFSSYAAPQSGDTYAVLSGTSMATPHVAGLAGLIWSINPALSALRVRQILEVTANDLGTQGRDIDFGAGRINAGRAAVMARATLCAADTNEDGILDFFDYLDFVTLLSGGDRAADFNGDGIVDFFDYLDFAAAFATGCP